MTTVVINPNGTVTVTGPNTVTPNQAPVAPANPAAPTPTPAPANPAAPTPTPAPANPAPATPIPTPIPATPTPTPAPANPAGNNAGQQGGVVIIHPNNPTPTATPTPAPVAGPTTFVAQQTVDGGNRYFPNWVIGVIVFILLLLYILYQSGKDAEPAKTETPVVKIVNSGGSGSKNAVDPEARASAKEANIKADSNSQRIDNIENQQQQQQQQMAEEKNKKDNKSDCNSSDWLTF